jgi:hypothetical protein
VDEEAQAEYPDREYPALKLIRKWGKQIAQKHDDGVPLDSEKYGPLRRVRRRYEEWLAGTPLPKCPVESLSLQPLYDRG